MIAVYLAAGCCLALAALFIFPGAKLNNPFRRRQIERAKRRASRARAQIERHRAEDETKFPTRGNPAFTFGHQVRPYYIQE